ncbi:DNA-binding transcriptional LysR family regulator [Variovorax boronicumulans]|uniref:LysR family transcriptional regulator n=1 Tax=Variovorax boronicumulans TaxID=436515 RepID=UPI00277D76CC|nr:LysR family transcriptional regulator [Variovorax boronicumulans]MDQ0012188.1 DNA-binding transcriptional LysR family regulator [Variovorax boronicumulans]
MPLSIRDLEFFLRVAELGQFAKAAAAEGESDAAVTKAVRRLEAEVGLPLFERVGQGVQLTSFGRELLTRAYRICTSHRDLVRYARDVEHGRSGVFRVSGTLTTLRLLIEPALAHLHAQVPETQVELATGSTEELLEQLDQGQIDVAVLPALEETPPRLEQVCIWRGHLVPVVRNQHPLCALDALRIEDLSACSWILPSGNPRLLAQFRAIFAAAGMKFPRVAVESTMGMIADKPSPLTLHTDLITYMAEPVAESFQDLVTVLPLKQLWQPLGASAMSRTNGYWSPVLEKFVESLKVVGAGDS